MVAGTSARLQGKKGYWIGVTLQISKLGGEVGYPICQEQNRLYLRIPYPNDELELLPQPAETTHRRSEPRSHTYTRKKGDSRLPMVNGRQPKYTVVKNGGGGGGCITTQESLNPTLE